MDVIVQDVVLETSAEINLQPNSQQNLLDHKLITLVYLQHLDCDLYRQTLPEMRQIAATDPKNILAAASSRLNEGKG
jgi:hypothetical protein